MIKEINKGENGFRISTDKCEILLDYCKMHEIVAYKDDVVFGQGDGHLVSLNIVTDEYELWTPFKVEYKHYEVELCGERCYYQCSTEFEEEVYEPIFDYLKGCPVFNCIQELVAYLISEYIKCNDADTVGNDLSELFPPNYYSPEEYEGQICKYNSRFEYVLQLAEMIVNANEE